MQKVIVLGAGRGQIPIMDLCHNYGWEVIAISPEGDYPGLEVADKICYGDVRDKERVLELARQEKISAILTDQLDAGVLTAAYVAEKLGIKGITTDVALKFTDKSVMREEAKKVGIAVPEFICVKTFEEFKERMKDSDWISFPLIIKPVDNAASRGVYKVNTLEEIRDKFDESISYSKSGQVIIEQFISGKEYVIEAYTKDYNVENLIVGHRDYFNVPDTFIPNATLFVDALLAESPLEKRLKEYNKRLVENFHLKFGITHGEYIYNEDKDQIYLIEIAARGGGVFISSELIPATSGINANDLLVREALTIEDGEEIIHNSKAAAYFCYLVPEGRVSKIEGVDKVQKIQGVRKAFFDNIALGMQTKPIKDKSSRKGPILVQGKTKTECYEIIEKVKKVLNIEIETSSGNKKILWN